MKRSIRFFAAGGAALALVTASAASDGDLRSTLDRWVETRKLIAEEKEQWREEEEALRHTVELLENELARLTENVERMEAENTAAGLDRIRLNEENDRYIALGNAADERIARLETSFPELLAAFPEPLRERTRPLRTRIAGDGADELSRAQRLQNLVGLLGEADRFQETVSAGREILTFDDGAEVEVRVLYLGLGQAYYLSPRGDRAGIGRPGETAWEWTPRPELAADIRRAFAVHDNEAAPEFIRLPVTLNDR